MNAQPTADDTTTAPAPRPWRRALIVVVLVALATLIGWGAREVPAGPATGTTVDGPVPGPVRPDRLRIGSFNVHGGRGADERHDVDRTAAAIRAADLDVVALQEVTGAPLGSDGSHHLARVLGDRLGVAALFAPTERRWWRDSFGNGLLTRVPIESWRRIPLASPGGSGHRNLLLAEVRIGGARVRVLTTHLDRQRPREGQLRAAVDLFKRLDPPAVLLGDLNTLATDPVLQELADDPTVTNPLRAHVPDLPAGHIDWIFARGLTSTAAGVGPVGASDHPLVWAEFALP